MSQWEIFQGNGVPHDGIQERFASPPWRDFSRKILDDLNAGRGATFQAEPEEVALVNAALQLRRPLLVTGNPGIGKSSLAYAVAYELKLGRVLHWSITSRSTLQEGLYQYDAIGRLQEVNANPEPGTTQDQARDIGRYIRLGPLGTALRMSIPERPCALLIDEIDKSDIDLPNDLLHIFEEGEFTIPEITRLPPEMQRVEVMPWHGDVRVLIENGRVSCQEFPFVIFTSNGEREFPPAFLRRCIRLDIQPQPSDKRLMRIVTAHLGAEAATRAAPIIRDFVERLERDEPLATDQLLNAIFIALQGADLISNEKLYQALLRPLGH